MSTKHYIELDSGTQFIVTADDAPMAVALLLCREIDQLSEFSESQLALLSWSQFEIFPEYWVHHGRRAEATYLHTSEACKYLTQWQIRIVLTSFEGQFGHEFVQDFLRVSHGEG